MCVYMCVCVCVDLFTFTILAQNLSFQDSLYAFTVDFSKLRFFGGQVNILDLIAFQSCVSLGISVMRALSIQTSQH